MATARDRAIAEFLARRESSLCQRLVTFEPLTKLGFFAGGAIAAFTTGGLSAIAQAALWGAVSGKIGDIGARAMSEPCRKLSESCRKPRR